MELPASAAQCPQDGTVPLQDIGIIAVTGPDASKYLQGQLTIDVNRLDLNSARFGAHCDFKGKSWAVFLCLTHGEGFLLMTPRSGLDGSLAELKKYGVFSQVEIEDASDQWQVLGLFGEGPLHAAAEQFGTLSEQHLGVCRQDNGIAVTLQSPQQRALVLLPAGHSGFAVPQPQLRAVWEMMDIQSGIANIQQATSNAFVPQMLNVQAIDGIDFDKGCYMGQEVVARTKYLGKNKRAAFVLCGEQASDLAPGDNLEMQAGDNWRRAGTALRVATLGQQTWCLAVLPNDLEQGALLRSKEQPEAVFTVQPLPYSLE
ncbi:tRNA-modifying protein YgfZ [Aestuariibacter halophilus]|uniref:tRNA-modifying protein YgfZ n=1 Tax=Fluctibacter halophilus TaxID=226011 RepID=A0ABS8G2J3_9ALTE|nr:tRNA-modifying protein YgfZ [Aestuariibacter halophilus]MCC2614693.1 tRNA-modifying protein YgfZ [Aestuariibacter halophilus]